MQAPALTALAPYAHVDGDDRRRDADRRRSPDLGVEGYELLVPFEAFDRAVERAVAAGATPAGLEAWEIARVEAGRPEWGIDIDDNTIPQEANFDELDAISYTKGCYIGQEAVARVHFRGHVNRHLRGLRARRRRRAADRRAAASTTPATTSATCAARCARHGSAASRWR